MPLDRRQAIDRGRVLANFERRRSATDELAEALRAIVLPEGMFWIESLDNPCLLQVRRDGEGFAANLIAYLAFLELPKEMGASRARDSRLLVHKIDLGAAHMTDKPSNGVNLEPVHEAIRTFEHAIAEGTARFVRDCEELP